MKTSLSLLILAGWSLAAVHGQGVVSGTAPTNQPPVKLDTSVTLRALPQQKTWPLLGTHVRDAGLLVKLVMREHPLRAFSLLATMPTASDYRDLTLDPQPVAQHGLALFWISF